MFDPAATYRNAQVTSANGVGQIVLLYQGAIRFASQHLAFLERHDVEQAHRTSIRCQEIVVALRASLDTSAGDVAVQLDELYEFALRRLVEGNVRKDPKPTEEAIEVLRGLLDAWQAIARGPIAEPAARLAPQATSSASTYAPPRPGGALVGSGAR